MKKIELPEDYAIVLQQVKEMGEEDLVSLAESLRISRPRLMHIVKNLQHKGLILVRTSSYSEAWIRLSAKGQRLMNFMWPEAGALAA
jgi:DNA-binding MarR family transcriptional regulator